MTMEEQKNKRLAAQMERLYVSEWERHLRMSTSGGFFVLKENGGTVPLTREAIRQHIAMTQTIGVYASAAGSRFICFDVDEGKWDTVQRVMMSLSELGISEEYQHVSLSGGKGFHVEVFFDALISMSYLRTIYNAVLRIGELDSKQVELRPTPGQGVKLPLSIHRKTGMVCWFVDRHTQEPIMTSDYLMDIELIDYQFVQQLVKRLKEEESMIADENNEREKAQWSPVMIAENGFAPLKEKHTRHNVMRSMALYCRSRGAAPDECRSILDEWYKRQDTRMIGSPVEEVRRDVDFIVDWAYRVPLIQKAPKRNDWMIGVTRRELLDAIGQNGKAARKIHFSVAVREKAHRASISIDKMAENLGIHSCTVSTALSKMVKDGTIRSVAGKNIRHPDGNFYRQPTAYYIADKGSEGYHTQDDAQTVMVSLREVETNGTKAFYRALGEMFDMRTLVELLNKTELLEYLDYTDQIMEEMIRAHGGTSTGANAQSEVAACGGEAETRDIGAGSDCDADAGRGAAAENGVSGEDIQATQCGDELPASAEGWQQCGNDGRCLSQAADVPDAVRDAG